MHGQSAIFKGEMGIMLTLISGIIIVERLANRTDTKAVSEDGKKITDEIDDPKSFFNSEAMFKRTSTARSMTIKLKTMKTTDLDIHGDDAQNYLSLFTNIGNDA